VRERSAAHTKGPLVRPAGSHLEPHGLTALAAAYEVAGAVGAPEHLLIQPGTIEPDLDGRAWLPASGFTSARAFKHVETRLMRIHDSVSIGWAGRVHSDFVTLTCSALRWVGAGLVEPASGPR
jgi:hypothetical protein